MSCLWLIKKQGRSSQMLKYIKIIKRRRREKERETDCLPDVIWVPCCSTEGGKIPASSSSHGSWTELGRDCALTSGMRGPREVRAPTTSRQFHAQINLQNIQTAHTTQQQKNKQPNGKMDRRTKQTFLQRRHTDGQQAHENMLIITNYQRNANKTTVRYHLTPVRMAISSESL